MEYKGILCPNCEENGKKVLLSDNSGCIGDQGLAEEYICEVCGYEYIPSEYKYQGDYDD